MAATTISIQTLYLYVVCCQVNEVLTERVSIVGNTEAHINCSNNYSIDIDNVTVTHLNTSCTSRSCNLELIKDSIIRNCDGKKSCLLMSNVSDGCLLDPGFVNFSYQCKAEALFCDFDNNVCNWKVYDMSKHYLFKKVNRNTFYWGPLVDHTTLTGDGFYFSFGAYDDTSHEHIYLRSRTIVSSYNQCLSFWYNMNSISDISSLRVYQIVSNNEYIRLWETSGIKGYKWCNTKLNIKTNFGPYTIAFGSSIEQTVALDDIAVYNTKCKASQFDCDFETQCWWTSDDNKEYRWILTTGQSPGHKGPTIDRTTGSSYGQFMYLEANDNPGGSKANFSSPIVSSSDEVCFSFWYHIDRPGTSSLAVYLDDIEGSSLIWTENGDNVNKWSQALINISSVNSLTLRIEGSRGNSNKGDIAVDDIALSQASCSGHFLQSHTCLPITEPIQPMHCPNHFIDFKQSQITFEPWIDSCGEVYKALQHRFRNQCIDSEVTECSYNISNESQKRPECFLLNNIRVDYTCKGNQQSTTVSELSSILSSSATSVDPPSSAKSRSSSSTTYVEVSVGVTVLVLFICLAVVLTFFGWKRWKTKGPGLMEHESVDINDYTGIQNIAVISSQGLGEHHKLNKNTTNTSTTDSSIQIDFSNQIDTKKEDFSPYENFENGNIRNDVSVNGNDEDRARDPEQSQTRPPNETVSDETYCNNVTALEHLNVETGQNSDYEIAPDFRKPDEINVKSDIPRRSGILRQNKMEDNKSKTPFAYELAKPITNETDDDCQSGVLLIEVNEMFTWRRPLTDCAIQIEATSVPTDETYKNLDFSLQKDANIYGNSAECVYNTSSHRRKQRHNGDDYDHCVSKRVRFKDVKGEVE